VSYQANRVLPAVLVAVSGIWVALLVCPLLYSVIFPSPETRQLILELEGHGDVPQQLAPLVLQAGQLTRAIPVKKYWHFSGEYSLGHSHTTLETEISYISWFQKSPKSTLLVITRTVTGPDVTVNITVYDRSGFSALSAYYVPVALLVSALFWLLKGRALRPKLNQRDGLEEATGQPT
jgi:hypothetical protein